MEERLPTRLLRLEASPAQKPPPPHGLCGSLARTGSHFYGSLLVLTNSHLLSGCTARLQFPASFAVRCGHVTESG